MREGTAFLVIEFPGIWPPGKNIEIGIIQYKDLEMKICSTNEGRLEFYRMNNGDSNLVFRSQQIVFMKAHRGLLSVVWDADSFLVRINGVELLYETEKMPLIVVSKYLLDKDNLSLLEKNRNKRCKYWMDWRKHHYGELKKVPKKNRRIKSLEEQILELKEIVKSLTFFCDQIYQGNTNFIPSILPILRALVFWGDKRSKNYNPLLIRIAGLKNLPLPIFILPSIIDKISFPEVNYMKIFNNSPTIFQKYPNQELFDLQDWLHTEVVIIREKNGEQDKIENYRLKDLIFDAPNTLGSAHFDEDVPEIIDLLKKNSQFTVSMFIESITNVSETIIFLADFVIEPEKYRI